MNIISKHSLYLHPNVYPNVVEFKSDDIIGSEFNDFNYDKIMLIKKKIMLIQLLHKFPPKTLNMSLAIWGVMNCLNPELASISLNHQWKHDF